MSALARAAAILLLLAAAPPAAADVVERFGGVEIRCDDARACTASIRAEGDGPGSVLRIARGPASRARWTLSIATLGALADRDRPVAVTVDNGVGVRLQPIADYAPFVAPTDFYVLSQSALDRLVVRLFTGASLRFSYVDVAGAPHTDVFRLRGLADALDAIDDVQRRVVGDRRFGRPEGLEPAPAVDRRALVAGAGVPPRLAEWHAVASGCEAADSADLAAVAPIVASVSDTATVYALPCFRSAGRTAFRLYEIESGEIGGMHLLVFAGWSPRLGWFGTDTLDDVELDGARLAGGTRDPGGCAGRGTWSFDAYAYRLDRFEAADRCGADPGPLRPVFPTPTP
ncbi:hypothetical protein [Oharaeibacter diazotrophicus]|uniref:DUF1176 domain-containing protein n=3 Tax=Oharaeibacter diazotrophicus TaxID=1920512 RepID=A0A4R6R9U0_9HYPH|nr:hypothetical protein [Oharaeibacter diazotrophicus]TDP82635.1 hypothetical protein EDD54_3904 [Oharaeibacter diazotrophicus]BBE72601.1 hypothetical protein OHA_1_02199 [Pleomorphomonas sp. SM30]GLS76635.1 hypothetical protein GCM10007904_19720 [Oharaeibacter diazotrophicus]